MHSAVTQLRILNNRSFNVQFPMFKKHGFDSKFCDWMACTPSVTVYRPSFSFVDDTLTLWPWDKQPVRKLHAVTMYIHSPGSCDQNRATDVFLNKVSIWGRPLMKVM